METIKTCNICKESKPLIEFSKSKNTPDGLVRGCKKCEVIRVKKYTEAHKENVYKYGTKYRAEHKEEKRITDKKYQEKNKEKLKIYHKEYYVKNLAKIRIYKRGWEKRKRDNDPIFSIKKLISRDIREMIKENSGYKNRSSWLALPYTPQQLKEHLENQFEDWMSWENYGAYNKDKRTWSIDHITPQSLLPYDSLEHPNFLECWKLSNLRPLCLIENIKKGNKVIDVPVNANY